MQKTDDDLWLQLTERCSQTPPDANVSKSASPQSHDGNALLLQGFCQRPGVTQADDAHIPVSLMQTAGNPHQRFFCAANIQLVDAEDDRWVVGRFVQTFES